MATAPFMTVEAIPPALPFSPNSFEIAPIPSRAAPCASVSSVDFLAPSVLNLSILINSSFKSISFCSSSVRSISPSFICPSVDMYFSYSILSLVIVASRSASLAANDVWIVTRALCISTLCPSRLAIFSFEAV